MLTLLAFVVAIGVLVTLHELGHYLVARRCGVRVLRFSIGFGKPLLRVQRGETEWVLAAIPLGGYVKMLDEREGEVPPALRMQAFNTQPVLKRMAIVAAGPLANFLVAIVLLFAVLLPGGETLKPVLGTVLPQTAAQAAGLLPGDRVLQVNAQTVANWDDIRAGIADAIGREGALTFRVQREGRTLALPVDLSRFGLDQLDENSVGALGIGPQRFLTELGHVEPGSAAATAGLRAGDTLLALNGAPLADWGQWVRAIQAQPGQTMTVRYARDGKVAQLTLRPDTVEQGGVALGRIGAAPKLDQTWLAALRQQVDYTPWQAAQQAVQKTWALSVQTLTMMGGMFAGQVSLAAISGPLTIADYAGRTAEQGWQSYLSFMAVISVSLAVLNLLPVPVLDGGHLLYYVAELVRGRPLSERTQQLGQRLGLALLLTLMVIALFNDVGRLLGG